MARKRTISEIGSAYVHRWGEGYTTLLGPLERANLNHWTTCELSWVELSWVEFILRPTVSRPVRPGIGLPFGAPWSDFILILSLVTIAFVVLPVGRPLWREDESVTLQRIRRLVRSLRTNNHTLPSHLRLCSLSVASYDVVEVEINLRPTVSRPVCLGVRGPSGTRDRFFSFSLKFPLDSCVFVILKRPLWREDGSVIYLYNCFSSLPEQSLLGRSPAELTTIFYCLVWDSLNLEGQVPVFISPRNRVAQLYPRALGSLLSPLTTRRDAVEVF
jgi:hypothetical protein